MNDREQAWGLLTEFTQSESLRKHGLAVEACMRAYARKFHPGSASAEELWGVVGLLHDFDYEKYPSLDDHPYKGNEILKERGYPDEIRRAIMSHAEYSGVTRDSAMEKALFACDELAGFITACALVKPGKSLSEVGGAFDDVFAVDAAGEGFVLHFFTDGWVCDLGERFSRLDEGAGGDESSKFIAGEERLFHG